MDTTAHNRRVWNRWAEINYGADFYGVEEWKAGRSVRPGVDRLEAELLGDVTGKSLLHLMCHFGLDTLTQARRGAKVTGVDFSATAIARARELAREAGLEAEFVECDIYEIGHHLDRRFDLVFTSIGVLSWLSDLLSWARSIAHHLEPGGRFVLLEAHPTAMIFDDEAPAGELRARYPYFQHAEPLRFEQTGCYADPDHDERFELHEWQHPLSEVVGALLGAGLRIVGFEEYDYLPWKLVPWMVERPDRCFELPEGKDRLPLMFSLVAQRELAAVGDPERRS